MNLRLEDGSMQRLAILKPETAFLLATAPVLKHELIQTLDLLVNLFRCWTGDTASRRQLRKRIDAVHEALRMAENRSSFDKLIDAHVKDEAARRWEIGERMGPPDPGASPEPQS